MTEEMILKWIKQQYGLVWSRIEVLPEHQGISVGTNVVFGQKARESLLTDLGAGPFTVRLVVEPRGFDVLAVILDQKGEPTLINMSFLEPVVSVVA